MHIAIFTNNYLPNPYGVSGSVESFRKELERAGHTVYVLAPSFNGYLDENKYVFRYPSIDFKFKNVRFPIAIPYSHQISRLLEKLEIDVIHSQHPSLLGWQAKRWAKKKNVPLIFTWHTLYDQYAHFVPLIPSAWAAWWAIGNAKKYANNSDCVIVPTPSVREIISNWGVFSKKIVAIPTGVDESIFSDGDRGSQRKKLGIAEDEIVLLLVSRLTAEKNVTFLAEVVAKILSQSIRSDAGKVKFIFAGGGDKLEVMKQIFSQAGVAEKVSYLGIINEEKRKDIYAAADIFVYASKSETQGMVISEAMYCGLPVVAVVASGVKDLVINQVTGLLVKEDEKAFTEGIKRLVDDESLRKKFSENARKISRQWYTSKVCTQKLLKVYQASISGRKERKDQTLL